MLRQQNGGQRSGNSSSWPSIKTRSNPPPPENQIQQPIQQIDGDDGGYVSLRNFNPTFGDALAQALEQSSLEESGIINLFNSFHHMSKYNINVYCFSCGKKKKRRKFRWWEKEKEEK